MKKYIAITVLIILGVLIYKERFMLGLGFDYLFSKNRPVNLEPSEEQQLLNPLDVYMEPTEKPNQVLQEPATENADPVIKVPENMDENKAEKSVELVIHENIAVPAPEPVQKSSFEAIAAYYNKHLTELEKEFRSDLNALIASAVSDYNSGNYKKLELAKQYLKKGEELEKSSDTKFYGLLDSFESELLNNGYNAELIKDVDKYYTAMKKAEKTRIVDTGMSIVNN